MEAISIPEEPALALTKIPPERDVSLSQKSWPRKELLALLTRHLFLIPASRDSETYRATIGSSPTGLMHFSRSSLMGLSNLDGSDLYSRKACAGVIESHPSAEAKKQKPASAKGLIG